MNTVKQAGRQVIKRVAKQGIYFLLPIFVRKHLSIWIHRQTWIAKEYRSWLAFEVLKDWSKRDAKGLHKFLWGNHIGYASTYEVDLRFGYENFNETRKIFFNDVQKHLRYLGINAKTDVTSVYEVGCSLGYLLRHMETDLFPAAEIIEGVDIDCQAIKKGSDYLKSIGSKINLVCGDMEALRETTQVKEYDVIICAGVLMYLEYEAAFQVVKMMLERCGVMVAIAGLADPKCDNSELQQSNIRESDHSFIHNIDSMVLKAGGNIIARRYEGSQLIDGNTVYFVFANKV